MSLLAVKKPKNMNACTEVIFTVFKGYILAYTCKGLGIDIDSDISLPLPKSASRTDKLRLKICIQIFLKRQSLMLHAQFRI